MGEMIVEVDVAQKVLRLWGVVRGPSAALASVRTSLQGARDMVMLPPMRRNTRLNALTLATCISLPLMASACKGGAKEQAKAEYKQNVVDMLDMVGAENDGYLIVRDLTPFWQATEYGNKLVDGPVAKVLDMVEATGEKVEREEF